MSVLGGSASVVSGSGIGESGLGVSGAGLLVVEAPVRGVTGEVVFELEAAEEAPAVLVACSSVDE